MNLPTSGPRESNDPPLPELYSKTLILVFAMLFSVLFAAILLIFNLRKLGKRKAATFVLLFAIGFLFLTAWALQTFNLDPGLTFVVNVIGAAVLNEFFWNKYIGKDRPYVKKNWIHPLMLAMLVALIFLFIVMTLL